MYPQYLFVTDLFSSLTASGGVAERSKGERERVKGEGGRAVKEGRYFFGRRLDLIGPPWADSFFLFLLNF
jgi:hypothetical protein